jgi:hypothetical protein
MAVLVTEPLLTVLYDGEPMLEVLEDGSYRTVSAGVNKARVSGTHLDVVNRLGTTLTDLRQQLKCATINPYRDAVLLDTKAVMAEIPRPERGALRLKDIGTVLTALHTIAKRRTQ